MRSDDRTSKWWRGSRQPTPRLGEGKYSATNGRALLGQVQMPGMTDTAYHRELRGLGLVFLAQLTALIILCLFALVVVSAGIVATWTLASKFGPDAGTEALWIANAGVFSLGGLIISTLAWLVARALGRQRAKVSAQFQTRRSLLGATQLAAPPIAYLLFAYAFFTHTS